NKSGLAQPLQQLLDNDVGVVQIQFLTIACKRCSPPKILPKATPCRQVHIAAINITCTTPRAENGCVLFGFILIKRPGSNKALATPLLYLLLFKRIEIIYLDC